MRFHILGPLRVCAGETRLLIKAAQQRVVLAVLLIEAGRVVSSERLVDEIWGETPPRSAVVTVQGYVRRLRILLGSGGAGPLLTRGHGYELVVEDGELDAAVFDRLVDAGIGNRSGGRLDQAAAELSGALNLWQGQALADVPRSPTVAAEVMRLEQRRLTAVEERMGALLDLGRHADVVDELRGVVDAHPLRERLHGQLMLALYRCGRRAEALAAYRDAHQVLVAELGLEPGPQLRRLHNEILADDRSLAERVPSAHGGPAQLPADVPHFTGRQAQVARLDGLLPGAEALVVATITGTAGVGKTALAVHWAHRVRARFPDGQLYVNLRGYTGGRPHRPIDALTHMLSALGVATEQVPADLEAATGLYRTLLAGKRMLVLVDNASHPDQVRPLLPGTPGCLVLITSRDQLRGLIARDGAVRLDLGVLTEDDANQLLARLIRVPAEPELIATLAGLCGRLPLALRIAAANLAANSARPLAELIAELTARDRLSALAVEGDPQSAVRVAFDHSYATMPPGARRLFRLLGLAPGSDLSLPAAAALAGIAEAQSAKLLDVLVMAHLVDWRPPDRYTMHDLIRHYATELADTEDAERHRTGALARLYDHYLHGVTAAAGLLYPHTVRLPLGHATGRPPVFPDDVAAAAWLDAERINLIATVQHAAECGAYPPAWRLADALRGHLCMRMNTVEWATVAGAGMLAAEAGRDLGGRAAANLSLGMLYTAQSRYQEAIDCYANAADLSRRANWSEGEGVAVGNVGNVYLSLGRLAEAATHYTKALAIHERIGFVLGQAAMLGSLGRVHGHLGRLELAADDVGKALVLHRQTGSRVGESRNLANLGWAYHRLGRIEEALAHLTAALAVHRELGDRASEGDTARMLADVHRDAGNYATALELAGTAMTIARETGPDRYAEALALIAQADVHNHEGRAGPATDALRQALAIAHDLGNSDVQAEALLGLAVAHCVSGQPEPAVEHARTAHTIARQAGFRITEGNALLRLAAIALIQGTPVAATALAGRALALHRSTGHRLGQARAHLLLAHAHHPDDLHAARAHALFAEIGAKPLEQARILLGH